MYGNGNESDYRIPGMIKRSRFSRYLGCIIADQADSGVLCRPACLEFILEASG